MSESTLITSCLVFDYTDPATVAVPSQHSSIAVIYLQPSIVDVVYERRAVD